jgi:hypothetical protein
MRRLLACLALLIFSAIGLVYAAPVDVPTEIQGLEGNIFNDKKLGIGLSIAAEADFLGSRKLEMANYWGGGTSKVKGQFYTSKIILTLINKFDIYGIIGGTNNLSSKDAQGDGFDLNNKITWGAGLSMPIGEWKNPGIKFFVDTKYRAVNNISYTNEFEPPSPFMGYGGYSGTSKMLVDWQEWQAALGAAKKFKYFLPYLGIKYSDFREFSGEKANQSKYLVGVFVGCSITPLKSLAIDLQGRFFDETACVVKATYKI